MAGTANRSAWRNALISFAVLITILVAGVWMVADWWDPFNDASFDPAQWSESAVGSRTPMARDLINNHLPAGMLEPEVEAVLGAPTLVWTTSDRVAHRVKGSKTLAYQIGSEPLLGYDDAFVYVHLKDGRVVEAEINGY